MPTDNQTTAIYPAQAREAVIGLLHENARLREVLQRVVWLWEEDNVRYMRERGNDMAAIAKGALTAKAETVKDDSHG